MSHIIKVPIKPTWTTLDRPCISRPNTTILPPKSVKGRKQNTVFKITRHDSTDVISYRDAIERITCVLWAIMSNMIYCSRSSVNCQKATLIRLSLSYEGGCHCVGLWSCDPFHRSDVHMYTYISLKVCTRRVWKMVTFTWLTPRQWLAIIWLYVPLP